MLGGENEGSKDSEKKVYSRKKSFKEAKSSKKEQQPKDQAMASEELNPTKKSMYLSVDAGSDILPALNRDGCVPKSVFQKQDVLVRLSLSMKSKNEAKELKWKLEGERDMVRGLIKKIETKEALKNAGVGPPRMSKPLNQLNVSVIENSKSRGENAEKEKRTPKANKMYRNSDFLLAKDKIPPPESNKKMKLTGKKSNVEFGKLSTQVFKSCNTLLERLMKHKHGWVFNKPVDAVALGLHDYFEVIKKPMDLGTVKNRLAQNWYNTPVEFAEDVRLTFQNAMTYNPKEQDVYVMAELLSKIFEEKWGAIEIEYKRELKGAIDAASPPPQRKAPPKAKTRPDTKKVSESVVNSVTPKEKTVTVPQSGRVSAPKKPKARDLNKRELTYDEKQKLSMNLQSLPSEKLESVVHIIKKRNPSLTQQDDEIEVDIDSVDTETLWELDRFVTNYKKSLSKNKRKADIVTQLIAEPEQINQEKIPSPVVTENPKGSVTDEARIVSPPIQVEEQGTNTETNQGGGQSSSSSDSGSSSSGDSDGESSSGDGSDGENSPKKDRVVEI